MKGFFFETLANDDEAAPSVPKIDRHESPPKKKKKRKKEKKKKKEKMFWAKWNIFISILGQNSVTFYLVICLKKYFIFWLDDKKPKIEKCDMHEIFQKNFN